MSTPEGKVKTAVKKILAKYPSMYYFMPVPYGFGESTLDFIICFRGVFIAIETKEPGKKMTPRQEKIGTDIGAAGGVVFEIASASDLVQFAEWLDQLAQRPEVHNAVVRSDGKREAPGARVSKARRRS